MLGLLCLPQMALAFALARLRSAMICNCRRFVDSMTPLRYSVGSL